MENKFEIAGRSESFRGVFEAGDNSKTKGKLHFWLVRRTYKECHGATGCNSCCLEMFGETFGEFRKIKKD